MVIRFQTKSPIPAAKILQSSSPSEESMAATEAEAESKLQLFLQWLQVNGAELRGCTIMNCGPDRGFGVFSTAGKVVTDGSGGKGDGVVMVVPLDLAITPMRVLQDPLVGPRCRAMFDEGDVDDRFLVMLFLTVERLRPDSPWKPYFDMLPSTFGNPLWFTEDELSELKGTTLYRASVLQRKKLEALYEDKVKGVVQELLHSDEMLKSAREVRFEDFLWANSIFWTRALNIPFPRSYVFPEPLGGKEDNSEFHKSDSDASTSQVLGQTFVHEKGNKDADIVTKKENDDRAPTSKGGDTIWAEGLLPGIDFCNHGLRAAATWEVDPTGSVAGVPTSMYLILAEESTIEVDEEIRISYGNKGNEELLYLYGFVIDNNPDDFLMVHFPMEALQNVPFSDAKAKLLELQNAELRCLLPKSSLDHGLFTGSSFQDEDNTKKLNSQFCNYSWSGERKVPSYLSRLVFPQDFLTALRTIAMQEHELDRVSSLLEEVVGAGEVRQPSDKEVQAAVWEACGDYGALELLVDLLRMKMVELEEGTGTEASDAQLLENCHFLGPEDQLSRRPEPSEEILMTRNKWASIVYRRGQKLLTALFLKEAEHALQLCTSE